MNAGALATFAAELGDVRVVLAGTVVTAGTLARHGRLHSAAAFAAGIVLCIAATATLKLVGILLDRMASSAAIGSPSGHVSLGTAFLGSIALILSDGRGGAARIAIAGGMALIVFAIARSRIAADAHGLVEIVEGAVIGLASLAPLFLVRRRPGTPQQPLQPLQPLPAWPILVALAILTVTVSRLPDFDTEALVRGAADLLPFRDSLDVKAGSR